MVRTRFIVSAVVVSGCTALLGCSNGLTPELHSYSESEEQYRHRHARVVNNNSRLIWDDLEQVFLVNRTSRLHRFPAP